MTEPSDAYQREELTIDASKANINAVFLMVPISCMVLIPYYILWKEHFTIEALRSFSQNHKTWIASGTLIGLAIMVAGIVVHELIHGITWATFAKRGFKSIRFGVLWKELTPYCHCEEMLPIKEYRIGAIMPAVVLGFIPTLIAYVTGSVGFVAFGLFFTAAAAGDFMIINLLKKEKDDDLVLDHPTKIGCYIYRKPENPVPD
jgi:hypothetical protein